MHNCHLCHRSYSSRSTLARHKRNHDFDKGCTCTICGRTFCRTDLLKRHTRIHNQDESRRHQTAIACQHCRRSKLKCDGRKACSACVSRDLRCHYNQRATTATPSLETEPSSFVTTRAPVVVNEGRHASVPEESPTPDELARLDSYIAQAYFEKLFSTPSTYPQDSHGSPRPEPLLPAESAMEYTEEFTDRPTGSATEEPVLWASVLAYNVAHIRCYAPLDLLRQVPADNSRARDLKEQLVKQVLSWAHEPRATEAATSACLIYTLARKAAAHDSPALHITTSAGLRDSALVLWIYAGTHHCRSLDAESVLLLRRPQGEGGDVQVHQGNAYEILMEIALLCKTINKGDPSPTSRSVWQMAMNPFSEFLRSRLSAVKPLGDQAVI